MEQDPCYIRDNNFNVVMESPREAGDLRFTTEYINIKNRTIKLAYRLLR
jgi:hypothetical protein